MSLLFHKHLTIYGTVIAIVESLQDFKNIHNNEQISVHMIIKGKKTSSLFILKKIMIL